MFCTWKRKQQINTTPTKDKIENFWSGIWEKEISFEKEAPWIKNTRSKNHFITQQILDSVLKEMKNNGAPGNEHIKCYWIKRLTGTHQYLLS